MSSLLDPISPTAPCGEDLSFSSDFDAIQELRRADDPTLDQGEWVTSLKSADWPGVVARCDELLSNRSKDLRLLVWRVEALAHVRGYAGLVQGLGDCVAVCNVFWDGLHPQPEDGDAEQRAGTIRWLLGQLQRLARTLPVTSASSGRFTLLQMEEARQKAFGQPQKLKLSTGRRMQGKGPLGGKHRPSTRMGARQSTNYRWTKRHNELPQRLC